jgi:hypothetical protein
LTWEAPKAIRIGNIRSAVGKGHGGDICGGGGNANPDCGGGGHAQNLICGAGSHPLSLDCSGGSHPNKFCSAGMQVYPTP